MKSTVKVSSVIFVLSIVMPCVAFAQSLEGQWRNQDYGIGSYHYNTIYQFIDKKLFVKEEVISVDADSYEQEVRMYQGLFTFSEDQLCINLHSKDNIDCCNFKWLSDDSFTIVKDGEIQKFARAYSKKDKVNKKFIELRYKAGLRPPDFTKPLKEE